VVAEPAQALGCDADGCGDILGGSEPGQARIFFSFSESTLMRVNPADTPRPTTALHFSSRSL